MMLPPFDPDPECPFCKGEGFKRIVADLIDQDGRCVGAIDQVGRRECTNWSCYAEIRRTKGLTMKQAMAEDAKRTQNLRPTSPF